MDMKHQKLVEYPAGTLNALNAALHYVDPTKSTFEPKIYHGGTLMALICVPSLDGNGIKGKVSQHLGKTPYFVLIKYEKDKIEDFQVLESKGKHMGGQITPGEFIASSGAQTLLCGNLGHKAIQMIQKAGIDIYVGASGKVIEAVQDWSEGKLKEASLDSACADGHI